MNSDQQKSKKCENLGEARAGPKFGRSLSWSREGQDQLVPQKINFGQGSELVLGGRTELLFISASGSGKSLVKPGI